MITLKYLKEALRYDPAAGTLTWRHDRPLEHFKTAKAHRGYVTRDAGKEAGSVRSGYRGINIGGRPMLTHRIIYAMENSIELKDLDTRIDHKDNDTLNNKIENLRPATHNENMHNRGMNANNTSGHKGVSYKKQNDRWVANIRLNGVKVHLGYFDTPEAAGAARERAANDMHGDFARHAVAS